MIKREFEITGIDYKFNITTGTSIRSSRKFLYLEQMVGNCWRVTVSTALCDDISRIDSIEILEPTGKNAKISFVGLDVIENAKVNIVQTTKSGNLNFIYFDETQPGFWKIITCVDNITTKELPKLTGIKFIRTN